MNTINQRVEFIGTKSSLTKQKKFQLSLKNYIKLIKDKQKKYSKKYYQLNKKKLIQRQKEYQKLNKEKIQEYRKNHYEKNKEKMIEKNHKYQLKKRLAQLSAVLN